MMLRTRKTTIARRNKANPKPKIRKTIALQDVVCIRQYSDAVSLNKPDAPETIRDYDCASANLQFAGPWGAGGNVVVSPGLIMTLICEQN
jgi:hypothetical protein